MLSLFLVASLTLPSLMDACCFPDKIYMEAITAGGTDSDEMWMDFTQNKYVVRPETGTESLIINDLGEKITYTRYKDGSCKKQGLIYPMLQCFYDYDFKTTSTLAGVLVDSFHFGFEVEINDDLKHHGITGSTAVVKRDGCIPIMGMQTDSTGGTRTRLYLNVNTTVGDVSLFNHDVSDCVQL